MQPVKEKADGDPGNRMWEWRGGGFTISWFERRYGLRAEFSASRSGYYCERKVTTEFRHLRIVSPYMQAENGATLPFEANLFDMVISCENHRRHVPDKESDVRERNVPCMRPGRQVFLIVLLLISQFPGAIYLIYRCRYGIRDEVISGRWTR